MLLAVDATELDDAAVTLEELPVDGLELVEVSLLAPLLPASALVDIPPVSDVAELVGALERVLVAPLTEVADVPVDDPFEPPPSAVVDALAELDEPPPASMEPPVEPVAQPAPTTTHAKSHRPTPPRSVPPATEASRSLVALRGPMRSRYGP